MKKYTAMVLVNGMLYPYHFESNLVGAVTLTTAFSRAYRKRVLTGRKEIDPKFEVLGIANGWIEFINVSGIGMRMTEPV